MSSIQTNIPDLGQAAWAQQLMSLFPNGWIGDAGKAPGGVFNATMQGCAANLESINQQVVYGFLASRIATAVGEALDLVSEDFYGTALPRLPGESDPAFRSRIQAALLQPQVTRQAISNILYRLTGFVPRMMEPWYLPDCCAWDTFSYWDIDTQGVNPFRWASPELRYQGFIETPLPPYSSTETTPVWSFDTSWGYDAPDCAWRDSGSAWTLGETQVDNAITAAHAFGTIIWRKFISSAVPTAHGGVLSVGDGITSVSLALETTTPYLVLLQPGWQTDAWVTDLSLTGFTANFSAAPGVGGSTCTFMYIPLSQEYAGFQYVGDSVSSYDLPISDTSSFVPIVTTNWDTGTYTPSETGTAFDITWDTASSTSDAGFYYAMLPVGTYESSILATISGVANPATSSTSITIPLIPVPSNSNFFPFFMPSWDTTIAMSQGANSITATFGTAAPSGAVLYYVVFEDII